MAKSVTALVLLAASLPLSAGAADPTRPPPEFMPAAEGKPGSAAAEQAAPVAPPLQLQSVLVARGRQQALINGQLLSVGDSLSPAWGGARLLRLSETQAVLQGAQGLIVLELTPGIRKTAPGHPVAPSGTVRAQPGVNAK